MVKKYCLFQRRNYGGGSGVTRGLSQGSKLG